MTRASGEGDGPPAEGVYADTLCAAQCGAKWEWWCKGCNLTYCRAHATPLSGHPCREGRPCLPIFPASLAGGTP